MPKPLRGEVSAKLGNETYVLRLGIGELEELDNLTGVGTLSLLRSFQVNAKISNVVAILSQAITVNGKKLPTSRIRQIVEAAGFQASVVACVDLLTNVLVDPLEGNASAVAEEKGPATE